jgi:hypothetical protein
MKVPGFGVLTNPGASPIPAAQTWAVGIPIQSTWAGSSPFFAEPPTPASDVADLIPDIPDTQIVAATTGLYTVPPGVVTFVCATAGLLIQLNINSVWTTIFTTTTTATPITLFCDGANVRLSNTTGGAITCVMYRLIR